MLTTAQGLAQFAADYSKAITNETGFLPQVCHDPQWTSPCEIGSGVEGEDIQWQYHSRAELFNFDNIEHALELTLHHDIISYYGGGFGGSMFVAFGEQQIELLQVWNEEDLTRLCENMIGHLLMQQKLKFSPTMFIGCFVNSEMMLCIDNNSGEIISEIAGNKERKVLAPCLLTFLEQAVVVVNPETELAYQEPIAIKAGLMPRLKEVMKSLLGK